MATDIGVKLAVDGEQSFKAALGAVNSQLKNLKSEMNETVSSLSGMADKEELAAAKADILGRATTATKEKIAVLQKQYDTAKAKLQDLDTALESATAEFGENSAQAQKARDAYNRQAQTVNNLGTQLNNAKADLNNLGREMDDSGDKAQKFGDVLRNSVIGAAVISGIRALADGIRAVSGALKDTIVDSAAFADEILTLSTNTGLSTSALQEYKYMAELTDTSLDTITGSLAKLTRNMATAQGGTGTAAEAFSALGVEITNTDGSLRSNQDVFADVIDSLGRMENETQRDAYAMQIFGKSAQDLNSFIAQGSDGISAFAKEARDMGYVLDNDTLKSLGTVDDALQRFNNTTATIKNQLGVALAPLISNLSEKFSEWAANMDWSKVGERIEGVIEKIADGIETIKNIGAVIIENKDIILATIAAITAALTTIKIGSLISSLIPAITALGGLLPAIGAAIAAIGGPITLIVGAIAAVGAAIATLWNTNEGFRKAIIEIWENIKNAFVSAWESIKTAWDVAETYFAAIWEEIKAIFSVVASVLGEYFSGAWNGIKNVWDTVTAYFSAIWSTIKGIFSVVASVLSGDFSAAWSAIQEIVGAWTSFFEETWSGIKNVFSSAWSAFSSIGKNIVDGLKAGINNAWSALTSWVRNKFNNLVNSVKNSLFINSPSGVFRDQIGKMIPLGVVEGIDATMGRAVRTAENMSMAVVAGAERGLTRINMAAITAPGAGVTNESLYNATASAVNGMSAAVGGTTASIIKIPVMLDSQVIAEVIFDPLRHVATQRGVAYG